MSGTRESTYAAIRNSIDKIKTQNAASKPDEPEWSWSFDGRMYHLRRRGLTGITSVGTISIIPGHVQHEGVLLDTIVAHLNRAPA